MVPNQKVTAGVVNVVVVTMVEYVRMLLGADGREEKFYLMTALSPLFYRGGGFYS